MVPISQPATVIFPPQDQSLMWQLPTLSQVLAVLEPEEIALTKTEGAVAAEAQWQTAIAALTGLLQPSSNHAPVDGLVLAGPTPVFSHSPDRLASWVFSAAAAYPLLPAPDAPADLSQANQDQPLQTVGLLADDPLAAERFCLVLTREFGLLMVLGTTMTGQASFQFSFAPSTLRQAWQVLRSRLLLTRSANLAQFDQWGTCLPMPAPSYQIVTRFSRLLLAAPSASATEAKVTENSPKQSPAPPQLPPTGDEKSRLGIDIELLQAIAHEVRTPLATIRTLVSLVLKRPDLPPEVTKRLGLIHRECSEQIDHFNLIFRAAELVTSPATNPTGLTAVSLAEMLHEGIPRWQQQAARRNLSLEVLLPPQLPAVVSDPVLLDQVLTGLITHFSHSLPTGSDIQVQVMLAGDQLKLELRSQTGSYSCGETSLSRLPRSAPTSFHPCSPLKSVGQVLMLQPETGNLSLSLPVTKTLFHALGGKLIVRKAADRGETLTIFLPLGHENR
jgi:signal transduction histidine kinase